MNLGLSALLSAGILVALLIILLAIWTLIWKGIALWIAAQEKNKPWFVALLVLNTVGILEMIYIFFFSEEGKKYTERFKKRYFTKKK